MHLEGSSPEAVAKGAYTLCEHGPGSAPAVILAGTGASRLKPIMLNTIFIECFCYQNKCKRFFCFRAYNDHD